VSSKAFKQLLNQSGSFHLFDRRSPSAPHLDEEDQEAVRQHAVAALNLTQKAKEIAAGGVDGDKRPNTAFIEGVRKFAMDVRDLDIDLIDHINPFGEAYAILAKTMSEESMKQVAAVIAGRRINLTIEEARSRSAAGCPRSRLPTPGKNAWPRAWLSSRA